MRGTIDFVHGCVGAKGDEKEDVLLVGDNMVNQTIPLILCAEEDVEGNHGASIGKLDENMLFYACHERHSPGGGTETADTGEDRSDKQPDPVRGGARRC